MNTQRVVKGNVLFYYLAVSMEMRLQEFIEAALKSLDKPFQYRINTMTLEYLSGFINIDCTDIKKKKLWGCFEHDIDFQGCWLLGRVAREIKKDSPTGNFGADIEIIINSKTVKYKFAFHVSGYVRDSKHNFDIVHDPLSIPDNEVIGHVVDLKITVV